jgi:hypothetical protein
MNRMLSHMVAILTLCGAGAVFGVEFYVSPKGDDRNPGTLDRPFKTLERARAAVRGLNIQGGGKVPDGGVTVWLRGGRYELAETFVLGPEDSGQEGRPIVYRAYEQEQPLLSGGRLIHGWNKLDHDVPGLPEAARGKIRVASLPEAKDGKWPFRQLWKNGQRLTRARWPNTGESAFRVLDAAWPSQAALKDPAAIEDWRRTLRQSWRKIQFKDTAAFSGGALPADLANGPAELFCCNSGRWATMRIPIAAAAGAQVRLTEPAGYLTYYWGGMMTMCALDGAGWIENALSLLDQPGEWFLDRAAGRLYYIPSDGDEPNGCDIVAPLLEKLVWLRGTPEAPVRHVEFRGLAMEHAEWPLPAFGYRPTLGCFFGTQMTPLVAHPPERPGSIRPRDEFPEYSLPAAVDLMYARTCRMVACRVAHVGGSGIGLGEGCRQNQIVGCQVFDTGGNGVHVGLPHGPICAEDFAWARKEDEPDANQVLSCHIHHTSEMDWGAYGILNSYANRTRIAHNLVEHLPYSGIAACFSWACFPTGRDLEVTVEDNHIHHVMLRLFDGGAIYTKDGVARSSVIRGNRIHDVGTGHWQCNGIFLDDGSYGFRIEENLISNVRTPVRFNNTSKEKFAWGANYVGSREEAAQLNGREGGKATLDSEVRPLEDAPRELLEKAGPEEPFRSLLFDTIAHPDRQMTALN